VLGAGDILPVLMSHPLVRFADLVLLLWLVLRLLRTILPVILPWFTRPPPLSPANRSEITSRFHDAEKLLRGDDQSELRTAVITMDMLLDHTLSLLGYRGTVAQKIQQAEKRLTDPRRLWAAHRCRNQLVHELTTTVDRAQVTVHVNAFARALRDLNALEG
jgi:hypothetical protein